MQNWNSKIHPEASHGYCACFRVDGAGNSVWRDSRLGDFTQPISQCACDQKMTLNCRGTLQAAPAAWACPSSSSSINANVLECPRSTETSKGAAIKPHFDHLHSKNWDGRIRIHAHWENSYPGQRNTLESFFKPCEENLPSSTFYAYDQQLSQRVYRHEGLHHWQLNELSTSGKIMKISAGKSPPLPAIPSSYLVKTNISQNAPSHSIESTRPQSSLPNELPAGTCCENSVAAGHMALAVRIRLWAVLAQCCQPLNSLFGVHQDAICCHHYYAFTVVCWLFCIITTTMVLIVATAFASRHNGD